MLRQLLIFRLLIAIAPKSVFLFSWYCRFHLICPGIKFGERNIFWAWYKLKLICVLYFHFVPSTEKDPLAIFFSDRGGTNQVEWTIVESNVCKELLCNCCHLFLHMTFDFCRGNLKYTLYLAHKRFGICGKSAFVVF